MVVKKRRKSLSRPVRNSFKVDLTDIHKDEIAKKSIELKSSINAIKFWIKGNYPEEFLKYEKYNDWTSCFISRHMVRSGLV